MYHAQHTVTLAFCLSCHRGVERGVARGAKVRFFVQVLLLYYSGHGAQSAITQSPLAVAVDNNTINLQEEFIRAADAAAKDGSHAIILLMDACLGEHGDESKGMLLFP